MKQYNSNSDLIKKVLSERGVCAVDEICRLAEMSQPTVSRALRSINGVLSFKEGRKNKYGLLRSVFNNQNEWVISEVNEEGKLVRKGKIYALHNDHWYVDFLNKYYQSLPWFLWVMRPQGYLGRLAVQQNDEGKYLEDQRQFADWQSDQVLLYLTQYGSDQVGNLLLGHDVIDQYLSTTDHSLRCQYALALESYERFASSHHNLQFGSSAGGEQPKFIAVVESDSDQHVIVKFSGLLKDNPTASRYADLLRCEHLANVVLGKQGIAVAETRLLEGDRVFLESKRFDRVGANGRKRVVALEAIEVEYGWPQDNWVDAAQRCLDHHLLSKDDSETLQLIAMFGRMIHNTDMHFGNVSVFFDWEENLQLAPVYDMLPMGYFPKANGDLPAEPLVLRRQSDQIYQWKKVIPWACEFWEKVIDENSISQEFREIAGKNLQILLLEQTQLERIA